MQQEALWGDAKRIERDVRQDPRSDLKDHMVWQELLQAAWHVNQDLYYLLHGVRCGGAEVIKTKSSFRLVPGEWSGPEWEDIRLVKLSPFRDELTEVFKIVRAGVPIEFLRK